MRDKKIIALDLDGTLLNAEGKLTSYTVQTIQKIRKAGHTVLIATGRPYRMAKPLYDELKLDTPMINFNGALTHIPNKKWSGERSIRIDKDYAREFIASEMAFQADFIAAEYKNQFFITHTHVDRINPHLLGVETISRETMLQPQLITSDPHSLLMQTRAEDKYSLAEEIRIQFNHELEVNTWGGPLNILEVGAKGVTKASALVYLLDYLQIDKQQLVAFGDEQNDVQMLQLAGTAYAMKNANKTLLPYADRITKYTNTEDGVARELSDLFL